MENGRSEDNKMSRRMWEAVETKAGKTGVAKTKRRKEKRGEETKEERKKEEKEKEKTMEVKKVAEKWEIWDEEKEIAKLEEEAKRLVPEKFHKWIHVFGKKLSKRILVRKV